MKGYMSVKKINATLFLMFTLFLQGCFSFDTGPERSFADSKEMVQLQVLSITKVRAKVECPYPHDPNLSSVYQLKLIAEGRFVRHTGHFMKKGTPCLAVGFFPELAGTEDFYANNGCAFVTINTGLCGLPTLWTLVCEPFCDYYEKEGSSKESSGFRSYGLLGFSKYYRNVHRDGSTFVTTSSEHLSSFELFGYSVVIGGIPYEDRDYGSGCSGEITFCSSLPKGSQITIRIVGVPSTRSEDSNEDFSGIVGMEIPVVLP